MHEMQNRMKIAFCVKPLNLPFCMRIKGAPREVSGEGGSVGLAPALCSERFKKVAQYRALIILTVISEYIERKMLRETDFNLVIDKLVAIKSRKSKNLI